MSEVNRGPVQVQVWSDVACPWCWVGKRHLQQALQGLDLDVEIRWRAFELDPGAPTTIDDDVDLVQRLADKYGASRTQAEAMIDRMTSVGAERGLDFHFERVRPTNTFDAHRLLAWAWTQGRQEALGERLFEAYMQQGRSVADHEVLVELAADVGLDPEKAQAVLSTDAFTKEVRTDEAMAANIGVSGVPFFVVGERYGLAGAQPPELIREALERAFADASKIEILSPESEGTDDDAESIDACGPDGCPA